MLRTKDGDENSYKSSDAINNIDWSVLAEGTVQYEMMQFYKGLIQIRKSLSIFTTLNTAISYKDLGDSRVAITIDNHKGGKAMIIVNPTADAMSYNAADSWNMISDGENVILDAPETVSGEISVGAYSAVIIVNDSALNAN